MIYHLSRIWNRNCHYPKKLEHLLIHQPQSRDSSHTHLHLHSSRHADHLEDFTRPSLSLPQFQIAVPPHLEPPNPEDEDDVVPNEHAAFGIQRATQRAKEPEWRDLGLRRILDAGPPNSGATSGGQASAGAANGAGAARGGGPRTIR